MSDMIMRGKYDAKVVTDFGFVPKCDDLISRAWVLAEYDRQHQGPPGGARKIMVEAPAVDAVPVIHGRWVKNKSGETVCSECNNNALQVLTGCLVNRHLEYEKSKFCPNCGAKMEE